MVQRTGRSSKRPAGRLHTEAGTLYELRGFIETHRHRRRRLRASRSRVVVSIYPQIARRTVEQCARLTDYGAESKP